MPVTKQIGDISFQLQEEHDFHWLTELGEPFAVFDQQDSGNLSFGVTIDSVKRFVKYAGAKPVAYKGEPFDAIERLRQAIPIYNDLNHNHLVNLVEHYPLSLGYAAIFDWFDGECLHAHWSFPPPAKYDNPMSPYYRYKRLPKEQLLSSIDCIFSFHAHVEQTGYVAVDFYDGSILYDFSKNTTKICDIDYYQKRPFINNMGRMYGSSRFMSAEEFTLHAPIDERTNVFNMGAIVFSLAGGELDRSYEKWTLGQPLYEVALKAVEPERSNRYASVADLYKAWNDAK